MGGVGAGLVAGAVEQKAAEVVAWATRLSPPSVFLTVQGGWHQSGSCRCGQEVKHMLEGLVINLTKTVEEEPSEAVP